jgi:hypothetical protein
MLCVFVGSYGWGPTSALQYKIGGNKEATNTNDAPKSISIPNLFISPPCTCFSSHTFTQLLFHKITPTTNGHFVLYMYIITPSHELKLKPLSLNPKPSNKYQIQTHSSLQETTTHLHTHTLLKTILAISHYP